MIINPKLGRLLVDCNNLGYIRSTSEY